MWVSFWTDAKHIRPLVCRFVRFKAVSLETPFEKEHYWLFTTRLRKISCPYFHNLIFQICDYLCGNYWKKMTARDLNLYLFRTPVTFVQLGKGVRWSRGKFVWLNFVGDKGPWTSKTRGQLIWEFLPPWVIRKADNSWLANLPRVCRNAPEL